MNRAVVVGVADYGWLNQPLPGCTNDRTEWSAWLTTTRALGGDAIRVRADAAASRATLLADLHWLIADAAPGDQRVFVFAGHGARLRRVDPETGVADAIVDETLVAHPGGEHDYEKFMLFDSDLAALIDASDFPANARLTLVLDSCHSGGMMRDLVLKNAAADDEAPLPRCLVIPDDAVRAREWSAIAPTVRAFGTRAAAPSRVIVAAARPEQSAWDAVMDDGRRHGVFSFHALNTLRANPATSLEQLIAAVMPRVAGRFPQNPNLLGDETRFDDPMFN